MKRARVYYQGKLAGILSELDTGYRFEYDADYLHTGEPQPISLTLPAAQKMYESNVLFPFSDGLIPEGWLLDISVKNWKLNPHDRMSLLLACCRDCIGAVSIEAIED